MAFTFERGPGQSVKLRESKLRLKRDFEKIQKQEQVRIGFTRDEEVRILPEKKTRFGFNLNSRKTSSSSLAQSVPDFSTLIRKENRRLVNSNLLLRRTELTQPQIKSKNTTVFVGSVRGSVSACGGDKNSKGMVKKSYANVEDLKKISMAAASAINGGGGRRRSSLGYRQMY